MTVGLWFVVACAAATGVCFIAGLVGLGRAAFALQRRVVALADQPLLKHIELAQARVALAERRLDGVPMLIARARAAVLEIEAAVAQARQLVLTLAGALRLVQAIWQAGAPR